MAAKELYKQTDGRFSVRAWIETNTAGNPQYRIRFWYKGGEVRTITAKSEAEAADSAAKFWRAHIDGKLDAPATAPVTLGELRDKFMLRKDIAPATIETYGKILGRFVAHAGKDLLLEAVGKAAIAKWFASMECKPVSQASYLRTIKALFSWARKQKFMDRDPTEDQKIERHHTAIRPWLQFHEWPAFLAACGPSHRIRAEFTLRTGLRAAELANASWSWFQPNVGLRGQILVPKHKSKRDRPIPLDSRAREVLALAKAQWHKGQGEPDPSARIFGDMDPHNLRRDTVFACQRAGVTVCDFHGLRRSCGSRWYQLGYDLLKMSRLLGHADVSTTARHYAGIADDTLARAFDLVDAADLAAAAQAATAAAAAPAAAPAPSSGKPIRRRKVQG